MAAAAAGAGAGAGAPFPPRVLTRAAPPASSAAAASLAAQPVAGYTLPPSAQLLSSRPSAQAPQAPSQPPPVNSPATGGTACAAATALGLPLSAAGALKHHRAVLSEFEQSEVLEYPHIWFMGQGATKLRGIPGAAGAASNHGYDDERGDYMSVGHDAKLAHDHLAYRYEVLSLLGRGSFGAVLRCLDHKTQTLRAVKIIRNKKRFHHQALVEVKILEHLHGRDPQGEGSNMVGMHEFFYFRSHLCIVFELLSINLYEFIKNNNFQGLSLGLIRRFGQQLLVSLRFLKASRVIHCDLKPENILLRAPNKSGIKVIDFGSSCFEHERVYTYIQSRFYRSPEVILGLPYDTGIDMWSLGCILAELYTGYPLFPGENEVEQLACIMEVVGLPPRTLLDPATRRRQFFDSTGAPRLVPNSRGKRRRPGSRDLALALHCPDAAFISFLTGCLRWDPRERLSPEAALAHEWIVDGGTAAAVLVGGGAPAGSAPRSAYAPPPPVSSSRPPPQLPPPASAPRAQQAPQPPLQAAYGVPRAPPQQHTLAAQGYGGGYGAGGGGSASSAYASGAVTDRCHLRAPPQPSVTQSLLGHMPDVSRLFAPLQPLASARSTRRC